MDCPSRTGHDVAEAYVIGTLSEADAEAFEQHFFACAACLAQVQVLQEARDRLAAVPTVPHSPDARLKAMPWLGLAAAAAMLAAVGWWWQRGLETPSATPVAVNEPPAPGAGTAATSPTPKVPDTPVEAPNRAAVLAQLALVVPPRYVPISVRGEAPPAGSFDAAMAHYVAGRHEEAARALQALSEARPTDPGIAFFWGISELVRGRIEPAREGLTRAIAADVQPYADEAHFYLGKLYLANGDVDLGRMELEYAIEHDAGPEGEAQRILGALDRLPAR